MDFRDELQSLINRHSQENGSNTPDFILCEYLCNCLLAFDAATNAREKWSGRREGWRAPLIYTGPMDWKPPTQQEMNNLSVGHQLAPKA